MFDKQPTEKDKRLSYKRQIVILSARGRLSPTVADNCSPFRPDKGVLGPNFD